MTRDGEEPARARLHSTQPPTAFTFRFRTELGLQNYGMWGKLQNLDIIVVDIRTFPSPSNVGLVRELTCEKLVRHTVLSLIRASSASSRRSSD